MLEYRIILYLNQVINVKNQILENIGENINQKRPRK